PVLRVPRPDVDCRRARLRRNVDVGLHILRGNGGRLQIAARVSESMPALQPYETRPARVDGRAPGEVLRLVHAASPVVVGVLTVEIGAQVKYVNRMHPQVPRDS